MPSLTEKSYGQSCSLQGPFDFDSALQRRVVDRNGLNVFEIAPDYFWAWCATRPS